MVKHTNELVSVLSNGSHPVSFEDRISDIKRVKDRIDNDFVFVKFTQTQGGTELGINLIKNECELSSADFEKNSGKLHIVGTCELNYCEVKCIADIDLKTRKGTGHLEYM